MNSQKKPTDQERREFIKKSTLLGAGLASASIASTEVIADTGPAEDSRTGDQGYHLTQHVLDYYKSADL